MEKTNKELRFKYYATSDARESDSDKNSNDIAFVAQEHVIYTHDTAFGGQDSIDSYTKEEIDNKIDVLDGRITDADQQIRQDVQEDVDRIQSSLSDVTDLVNSIDQRTQQSITDLHTAVDAASNKADEVSEDLSEFKGTIRDDLNQDIQTALQDAMTDPTGKDIWTRIDTTDSSVSAMATKFNVAHDSNGNIKYTSALQTVIDTGIDNNAAYSQLSNRYAALDENQEVIRWMVDGFKGRTDEASSFAAMYAAGGDETADAIARVKTEVLETADGKYVAKTSLQSEVEGIVKDGLHISSLSDITTSADLNNAVATINTRFAGVDDSISTIQSMADANSASIDQITSIDQSGTRILQKSTLDESLIQLLADHESQSYSEIAAVATDAVSETYIKGEVETAVAEATSNFVQKNYVDQQVSAVDGKVNDVVTSVTAIQNSISDQNGNLISSANILEKATTNESKINQIATFNNQGTLTDWNSALITQANKDSAVASLLALATSDTKDALDDIIDNNDTIQHAAGVESRVTAIEGNYVAQSKLYAVADNNGDVTAASVMAAVNDADSSVTIDADRINLNGETWADVIHLDSEVDTYLTTKNVTISDEKITLHEDHDSDEQFTATLTPTMLSIAANDPTALRDGAVELDAEGLRFLGYLGGTRTGFQYGPEGISYNADSNKRDVIKAILSPEDGTFNSITLNSTVTTTGILSVPDLQIEDSGSGYIDAGPGGLTVHSGGSDLTNASIDTSGIEIQDYPHTVNLYADQVSYDSTSADWSDIIDAANNAIKTSGGNLDVDSITTQGVTMYNETQGNYTGTSLDGTCVLCEQYTDSSKTATDAVTEITPGVVRLNSYSDAAIVFESGSGSVRITPDGITYNGTTKTWTQIFAAIP